MNITTTPSGGSKFLDVDLEASLDDVEITYKEGKVVLKFGYHNDDQANALRQRLLTVAADINAWLKTPRPTARWSCTRCRSMVVNKRCNCTTSPSPWELLPDSALWRPLAEAPTDGTFVLLAGPSGYVGTPLRVEVGHYCQGYEAPWRNHANDAFEDGGCAPTLFMHLPGVAQ